MGRVAKGAAKGATRTGASGTEAAHTKFKFHRRPPLVIGIARLPLDFGWVRQRPPRTDPVWYPYRPPGEHSFGADDTVGQGMMDPVINLWIRCVNETGVTKKVKWKPLTYKEALRFLAFFYLTGISRTSRYDAYWRDESVAFSDVAKNLMSFDRYKDIKRMTKLYPLSKVGQTADRRSPQYDPMCKIRPLVEIALKSFRSCCAASRYLSLDEQMIKFKGRCRFKVRMKNKPIKCGLKVFIVASAQSSYILNARFQFTDDRFEAENLGRTFGLVVDLLQGKDLMDGVSFLDRGYVIFTDNFFTKVGLAYALNRRNTYMCGVARSDTKHLPTDILLSKNKVADVSERGGSTFRYSKCGRLRVGVWQDNRPVIVLCTEPNFMDEQTICVRRSRNFGGATKSQTLSQPAIVARYIKYMRGVDVADQRIVNQHQVHRNSRWYMAVFNQVLEWGSLNTGVILRDRPNGKIQWSTYRLKTELVKELSELGAEPINPPDSLATRRANANQSLISIRLNSSLIHTPVITPHRRNCVAHVQRKITRYSCTVCKVPICMGVCWQSFHPKRNYLVDDENCSGRIIHTTMRY